MSPTDNLIVAGCLLAFTVVLGCVCTSFDNRNARLDVRERACTSAVHNGVFIRDADVCVRADAVIKL